MTGVRQGVARYPPIPQHLDCWLAPGNNQPACGASVTMDVPKNKAPFRGPREVELAPGYQVGEYTIETKIGEGGFGTVFKAIHPLIGKEVAIKVLHRRYSAQPEMVSRFVSEARTANQIRQRHIIDIFAFGQLEDGRHYYVMDYLEGKSLEDHLKDSGPMTLAEALPILRALARALDAVHAKGIVHRDLKPENVFLATDDDGDVEPKLLDFGVAKLLAEEGGRQMHKTRTGAPIGTPQYMSPEQCRNRDVDHRTDIYSFGIMTYRMLSGVLPFDGEEYMDVLLAQMEQQARPPSLIMPTLTVAIDQAIAWMMRKDPKQRPPTVFDAVMNLEEAARSAGFEIPRSTRFSTPYHAQADSREHGGMFDSAESIPPGVRSARSSSGMPIQAMAGPPSPSAMAEVLANSPLIARRRRLSWVMMIALGLVGAVISGVTVNALLAPAPEIRESERAQTGDNGPDNSGASLGSLSGDGPDRSSAPTGDGSDDGRDHGRGGKDVAEGRGMAQSGNHDGRDDDSSRFVTITIVGPPAETEVYGPHGFVGIAPGKIQLLRGQENLQLVFKADKHRPRTYEITPIQDTEVYIELTPKRPLRSRPGPNARGGGKGARVQRGKPGSDKKKPKQPSSRDTLEDPF